MRIFGYTRMSTSNQEDSLDTQQALLLKYIEDQRVVGGFGSEDELVGVFSDPATSGSTHLFEREAGRTLMERASRGDHIVVTKLDRMFRSAADACVVLEHFRAAGIELHILQFGFRPDSPIGRYIYQTLAAVAELERELIRERTREGIAWARSQGRAINAESPLGWRKVGTGRDSKFVPDLKEQESCRTIVLKRDEGESWERIAMSSRNGRLYKNKGDWNLRNVNQAYEAVKKNFPRYDGKTMDDFSISARKKAHKKATGHDTTDKT